MSLSVKGTPNSAASTSVTIPTHAVGDIIVIFAYRDGSTTSPTKPAAAGTVPAWVDIDNNAGANTNSSRTGYFVATATNHTSGTWTNATGIVAAVLSGQAGSPIGGHAESGSTGTNTASAPAVTMTKTDGTSKLLHFYGHKNVTAWSAAPAGYTRQTSVATEVALNTKDSTTSDGAIAQANTATNAGYRGATVEILAAPSMSTLTDPFTTKDTTKWAWGGTSGVTGGQATQVPTLANDNNIYAAQPYDLTGAAFSVELAQTPNIGNGGTTTYFILDAPSASTYLYFQWHANGNLIMGELNAGSDDSTSVTYNSTNHRWLRIREASGSLFWDTSSDGISWTNRRTKTPVIPITRLSPGLFATYSGTEPSPGTAIWDNVNYVPAVASQFFRMW